VRPTVQIAEPDLVVLDLQIGNMGGMATCMDLRLDESVGALPHIPVLMLLDRDVDTFLASRADADGWVIKPLDPMELRRAAVAVLSGGTWPETPIEPAVAADDQGDAGEDEPEVSEDEPAAEVVDA
jgi:DNA-binding response OmpR family regulator